MKHTLLLSLIFAAGLAGAAETTVTMNLVDAKGVGPARVIWRHALANALLPTVTVIGIEFAGLLGGLVVTEQVFNINGIGRLLVQAIGFSDLALIQGLVMLFALIYVVVGFAVDVVHAMLDPRVRVQ